MTDARKAAEERWPALNPDDVELTYPRSALREFKRGAFVEGAEWQAARTPQITDEMVLAAVAAFRDGSFGNDYIDMRIALEAALEAALGQTNEEGASRVVEGKPVGGDPSFGQKITLRINTKEGTA